MLNDFLKNIQIANQAKESNQNLTKNLSGVFNNSTRVFASSLDVQQKSLFTLRNLNTSVNVLNKQLADNLKLMSKASGMTNNIPVRNFFKQQDPNESLRKNVIDIENLVAESVDMQKKEKQKGLMSLAGLMGVCGLIGYVLTGKGEMVTKLRTGLINGTKDLFGFMGNAVGEWYNEKGKELIFKSGKFIGDSLISAVRFSFDNPEIIKNMFTVTKVFKAIKNLASLKNVASVIKHSFSFAKTLSRVIGKGGFKLGGAFMLKSLGKSSKVALKKIPVLGALLGLFFGISRFKKGDVVGGLMEVASGISSIVPGIGTAIGLAIDGVLLFRDFKGDEYKAEQNEKTKAGIGKISKEVIRNLPGIGSTFQIMDGFKLWKSGKKLEGLKSIGRGLASFFPGGGYAVDLAVALAENVKENGLLGGIKETFNFGRNEIPNTGGDKPDFNVNLKRSFGDWGLKSSMKKQTQKKSSMKK